MQYYYEEYAAATTVGQYYTASSIVPSGKPTKITAGAELNVMASISGDGKSILLALNPKVNTQVLLETYTTISQYYAAGTPPHLRHQTPDLPTEELSTRVAVKSGETVVMGGVLEREKTTYVESVPVLGDIPILGALFRRRTEMDTPRYLLIFVTATIVKDTGEFLVYEDEHSATNSPAVDTMSWDRPGRRPLAMLKLDRMRPPVRRVLALDAGSRCIKLLLAESDFGRLHILKEELIDLQAEGLVSADEIKAHLQASLEEWGRPPLALVLPQHLSISQVIDLPLAPESEVEKLIQDETIKLGGVSESRIVYDFVRTETAAKNRQQFWVTLSQEGDIRERILRLGVEQEDLCEVTTTANALIAAYRAANPLSSRAILVHLGAQTTVVVILLAGQGVFATSFQMGGDFFTRSLARLRNCSEETAESLKRASNLLTGPEACPDFAGVVDGWVAELKRQLNEWFEHNPSVAPEAASFELVASGGGFDQPGLLDYLKAQAGLELEALAQGQPARGGAALETVRSRFRRRAPGARLQRPTRLAAARRLPRRLAESG